MGTRITDHRPHIHLFRKLWRYKGRRRTDGILTRSRLENLIVALTHECIHILMHFCNDIKQEDKNNKGQKKWHSRKFIRWNQHIQGSTRDWMFEDEE
jgi:hypothetical protein